ncbi:phage tail assembly chaperone [Dickeya dadantii]
MPLTELKDQRLQFSLALFSGRRSQVPEQTGFPHNVEWPVSPGK